MINSEYKVIYGEQKTDEWQKLREGLITGSTAKKVKGSGDAFLYQTLAIMTSKWKPKEAFGEDIDRGNKLEPEAVECYKKFTGLEVRRDIAFIQNGRIGVSPDGVPYKGKFEENNIKKLIEVKSSDVPNHIKYIDTNKVGSEYIDQIIHGFETIDTCDEIDFVSYCPMYKLKPLHIITVKRATMIVDISTTKIQYSKFIEKLDKIYSKLI